MTSFTNPGPHSYSAITTNPNCGDPNCAFCLNSQQLNPSQIQQAQQYLQATQPQNYIGYASTAGAGYYETYEMKIERRLKKIESLLVELLQEKISLKKLKS